MKQLAHVVTFYGKPGGKAPSGVSYKSNDIRICDAQVKLMQDEGYDGLIALWYGQNGDTIDQACQNLCYVAEKYKMGFALCLDPWAMGAGKATMTVTQKNVIWQALLAYAA